MTRPEARPNRGGPPGPQRPSAAVQAGDTNDVERYLRALFERDQPGALIEVRYRYRDGMRSTYFAHTDTTAAARTVLRLATCTDVYVGVAPRVRRAGGRDAIERVWSLWADLDDCDAAAALDDLPVAPAIVIASGSPGHVHAYWPLATAITVVAAEEGNRRLAAELQGDAGAVTNAATILRPPATYSYKTARPMQVVLQHLDEATTSLHAVTDGIAHDPLPARARRSEATVACRGKDPLRALDPALYVSVLTGQPVGRSRKVRCPFHDLSVGEAAADGVSPARSAEDASSSDRRASSDPLLLVAPPVYFERLTGLRVGPSGKLHCLFHDDRSPSLHVYREPARGWYCFGCGRGGSVYDLAALLLGRKTRGRDFFELRRELEALLLTG